MAQAARAELNERQVSTQTFLASSNPLVVISGLVFTSAGIVTAEVTGSGSTSGSLSTTGFPTATGSAASTSTMKSSGIALGPNTWILTAVAALVGYWLAH